MVYEAFVAVLIKNKNITQEDKIYNFLNFYSTLVNYISLRVARLLLYRSYKIKKISEIIAISNFKVDSLFLFFFFQIDLFPLLFG